MGDGCIHLRGKQSALRPYHHGPTDRAIDPGRGCEHLQSLRQVQLEAGAFLRHPEPEQTRALERAHHCFGQARQPLGLGGTLTQQWRELPESHEDLFHW